VPYVALEITASTPPREGCTLDNRVDNAFSFLPCVATIAEVVAFIQDVV
jgi:hypothetical protein